MLTKVQKNQIIDELAEKLQKNSTVVFTNYQGLKTEELLELRAKLRTLQGEYKVLKNTLSERAFQKIQAGGVDAYLTGPTAIVLGNDLLAAAKIVATFAKDHEKLKIKACLSDGKIYTGDQVKALAQLPPREVLLAKVVGLIASPLSRLVGVLSNPLRDLVGTLDALAKKNQA